MHKAPHYHPLVRTLASDLRRRCGVPTGARLILAVSGGADSVALMRAMAMLAPRRRFAHPLHIAHVHHHLRPAKEADGDAAFVEQLAGELDLPFHRLDIHPAAAPGNRTAAARRQRYASLATLAREMGADWVLTGHHADDQLETLLMRLIRGSGVRGMQGMRWHRRLTRRNEDHPVHLARPMLGITRPAITAWLEQLGQRWREDESNRDRGRLRNALRQQVLPPLTALAPDAATKAMALADRAAEASRLLDRATARALRRLTLEADERRYVLDRAAARRIAPGWLGLVLKRAAGDVGVSLDRWAGRAVDKTVAAIRDDRGGQRRIELPGGFEILIERRTVTLGPVSAAN